MLAGTNGAGKSSVLGSALTGAGGAFYDPDAAAREYVVAGLSLDAANVRAWQRGRDQLEHAIRAGRDYAFETTLGGHTITGLLLRGARAGHRIRVMYVGLAAPELHIRRVRERVDEGGHDIPEAKILERWDSSRRNLIRLLAALYELTVWDNSTRVDFRGGEAPAPVLVLRMRRGVVKSMCGPGDVPDWAKPIVAAAIEASQGGS